MAKRKVTEEPIQESLPEPEVLPEPEPIVSHCPQCSGTGERMTGWDEDGNDIINPCDWCEGDGIA